MVSLNLAHPVYRGLYAVANCVSVCLSGNDRYCGKTATANVEILSPSVHSPIIRPTSECKGESDSHLKDSPRHQRKDKRMAKQWQIWKQKWQLVIIVLQQSIYLSAIWCKSSFLFILLFSMCHTTLLTGLINYFWHLWFVLRGNNRKRNATVTYRAPLSNKHFVTLSRPPLWSYFPSKMKWISIAS